MRYEILALAVLLVAVLAYMYRRDRRRLRDSRAAMYEDCAYLFDEAQVLQDDVNFPILNGRYQGYRIKLEPIADFMAFRKIPSLWLLATVYCDNPYGGAFDFLIRPQNVEFWSPAWKMETSLSAPPGWPEFAIARTDGRGEVPPLDKLQPHRDMFQDDKVKELLVTPRGVRIVYQADQAERAYYMVLRQLVFTNFRLSPELVTKLLDRAISIHEDLVADGAAYEGGRIDDEAR
jgi:cbb3-type cytochrome oxidase subunit 3